MQPSLRMLLTAAAVSAAAFLTACKKDDATSTGTTTSSTNSNPDPIAVSTCTSATGMAKVLCLADAFKSQLDATQLTTLQRTYAVADAQKWSNLPQGLVQSANKRIGLSFGAMTTVQVQYAKALIKEISGTTANEG
ncbi:MAG: DUF3500 domain-containing protein, partial [Cytophagaceae bacterium]